MKKKVNNRLQPEDFLNPYEEIKKGWYRLVFVALLILYSAAIGITTTQFVGVIVCYTIIEHFYLYRTRDMKGLLFKLLTAMFFLVTVLSSIHYFGMLWGIFGYLLVMLCVGLFIVWTQRKKMKLGMQHIETKIWGKPLDKKYWKKNELKQMKYRVKL